MTDRLLGQNFPFANSLEGDIDTMIQSCISQDRRDMLEESVNSPESA